MSRSVCPQCGFFLEPDGSCKRCAALGNSQPPKTEVSTTPTEPQSHLMGTNTGRSVCPQCGFFLDPDGFCKRCAALGNAQPQKAEVITTPAKPKSHPKELDRTCPRCGKQILDPNAMFCPYCGVNVHVPKSVFDSPQKSAQKQPGYLIFILLLLIGVGIFACLWDTFRDTSEQTSRPPATAISDRGSEAAAYVKCKEFVGDRLVAPSTAEFASYRDVTVVKLTNRTDEVYKVVGYVDAQNRFGAMIRTEYVCEVAYLGNGSWQLMTVDIAE